MGKRPKHQRPADDFKRGSLGHWPKDKPLPEAVARLARYIASGEHKNYPSPQGLWTFAPKADKAKCPRVPEGEWPRLQETLRAAIAATCVDEEFRGGFPARAWAYVNDVLYEARLSNRGTGEYHGFPLEYPEQYPDDPDNVLSKAPRVHIPVH